MGSARTAPKTIEQPEFERRAGMLKTTPQGSQRSMAFLDLMADSLGRGMIGRGGKATMTDDIETNQFKEESEMADIRKRLLAKAKEDRETNQLMYAKEKQIYDQSLPNQQKNNSSDLQFMVRGG